MQKRVAVVTGSSRGVGKGVALELCQAGFMVYVTGRSAADMSYIKAKAPRSCAIIATTTRLSECSRKSARNKTALMCW